MIIRNNTEDLTYVGRFASSDVNFMKSRALKIRGLSPKHPQGRILNRIYVFCEGGKTFYGFKIKSFK